MESEWIQPTWEIKGDRLCGGKSICSLQTWALPWHWSSPMWVKHCKYLHAAPCACPSSCGMPYPHGLGLEVAHSPVLLGHGTFRTLASALMPRSPCTSLATAGEHSPSNASARGHLRSPPAKSGEAPTGGTYPDVPSPEDSVVAPSSGDLLFIFPLSFANFLLPKCCQKEVNHPKHWEHSHDICSWPHPPKSFFILAYSMYELAENNSPLAQRGLSSTRIPKDSGKNWAWSVKT